MDWWELVSLYEKFIDISDEEFVEQLPEIIHFACIVSYVKDFGNDATVGDMGIVHRLVHLLHFGVEYPDNDNGDTLEDVRRQFKTVLKLA